MISKFSHIKLLILFGTIVFFFPVFVFAQVSNTTVTSLELVPTYESISVYTNFSGDFNGNHEALLEYRQVGSTQWIRGMELTLDRRDTVRGDDVVKPNLWKDQRRGSILGVTPDTAYEVRVTFSDPDGVVQPSLTDTVRTWKETDQIRSVGRSIYVASDGNDGSGDGSEQNPYRTIHWAAELVNPGDTVYVKAGTYAANGGIMISRSGAPDNYITFRPFGADTVLIDTRSEATGFKITGSYLRVRGFTIGPLSSGAKGLIVWEPAQHVILEENTVDITGGRTTGIFVGFNFGAEGSQVSHITVQDNTVLLMDPGVAANGGTSTGPGVDVQNAQGQLVFRRNLIHYTGTTEVHGRDCFGGHPNKTPWGGYAADTDIYDNICIGATDDAISLDGGARNVRVWGNLIQDSNVGVSIAPIVVGPAYVFRNTIVDLQRHWAGCLAFKSGESGSGYVYIYHNTLSAMDRALSPFGKVCERTDGINKSGGGSDSDNVIARNNIWEFDGRLTNNYGGNYTLDYNLVHDKNTESSPKFARWDSIKYDTYEQFRAASGQETHGLLGQATFVDRPNSDYRLASGSLGIDSGLIIQGFNDQDSGWPYSGTAPDMGAFEFGGPTTPTPTPTPVPSPVPTPTPAPPANIPPNFKVAFLGDIGVRASSKAVLQLIKDEGADMAMVQGDLGYGDEGPQSAINWNNQVNSILGPNFPLFASSGNHDRKSWSTYRQLLQERIDKITDADCAGDLGANFACRYKGLFFILSGVGNRMGSAHDIYIKEQLAQDNSVWSICSWHKNQQTMQVGRKGDSTGWAVYEECRKGGAIIATGHSHTYSRTKTLINTETQTINPAWPDPNHLQVSPGSTFAFVSGVGGESIRSQQRCQPGTYPYGCNGLWASISSNDNPGGFGALFITFHVDGNPNKARGYFKDIDGKIIDSFTITTAGADTTAPSTPIILTTTFGQSTVDLTWSTAIDGESGIARYNVYRDGVKIETLISTSFSDVGLAGSTPYTYEISAVNGAGLESSKVSVVVTTQADTAIPTIGGVASSGDATKVTVVFSEPVELASAVNIANYQIDNAVGVLSASLAADLKTVTLTTSSHSEGITYTLAVNNVKDRAKIPNTITPNSKATYVFLSSPPAFLEENGTAVMEAEHYTLVDQRSDTANWVQNTAIAGFAGEGYMWTVNVGISNGVWSTASELSYNVKISTPGEYFIAARHRSPDGASNSVSVGVDDVEISGKTLVAESSLWIWSHGPSLGILSEGDHNIQIRRREDGFEVDRVMIADSTSKFPAAGSTVIGPAESSRTSLTPTPTPAPTPTPTIPGAPYSPSTVISGITWDTNTFVSEAPGSDLWPNTWGPDDNVYVSWGDGGGFGGTNSIGRVSMGFARIEGPSETYVGINVNGGNNPENPASWGCRNCGKTGGIGFVGGTLYAWVNKQDGSFPNIDESLAWSSDFGATWQQSSWTFLKGNGNFKPTRFLQFGKDYTGQPANVAGFVYFYGKKQGVGTEDYLGRVLKAQLKDKTAYEYFAGLDVNGNPRWTTDINQMQPHFLDQNGAGGTVVYNPAIKRYILAGSHGGGGKVGIFDAPNPWGPWTTVAYYDNWIGAGGGEPLVYGFVNKWTSANGLDMWMIFSCYNCNSKYHDRFNLIKATLEITSTEIQIPTESDWTDRGIVISPGALGTWDVRLGGAISPSSVVKKDGTYYLYYIGADGDRSTDGGPRHRALGVATSTDGINFVKHAGNPVITYLPNNNQEEGIFAAAAMLDDNGDILLYYGALRAANSTTTSVDVDIRMSTSTDGLNFANDILIRKQSGAEIEPIGVFKDAGMWYIYYINNAGWNLNLLSGPTKENLPTSISVLGDIIGGGDPIRVSQDKIALFLDAGRTGTRSEVRTASVTSPGVLSAPVEVYNIPNQGHTTTYLDRDTNTWFMYYSDGTNEIKVRTAPVLTASDSPPTPTPAPTPPPAPSTAFTTGDQVQATANLNVRATPSTSGTLLGSQLTGAQGTVIGGPVFAENFWWWQVDYDTGPDGWSVEDGLEPASASLPPPPTSGQVPNKTISFTPVEDTFVWDGANADGNFGSASTLEVDKSDGGFEKVIFMKFDVEGIGGAIQKAIIKLHDVNNSDKGGDIYRVLDTSWSESAMTWNNRPAIENVQLDSLGSVSSGNWYSLDVTSAVTGDGVYSFAILSPSSNGADYDSKEGSNVPVFEVTYATPPSQDPPDTPSGQLAPVLSSVLDLPHIFLDRPERFVLRGSDFGITEDFFFRLKIGGVTELELKIRPRDDSTIEVEFKSENIASLSPGFYEIEIERESDNHKIKHEAQILLTKLGDIWSATATESAREPRDGKIDIFDVSRLLSKWNSTLPPDLAEADINPGPNNISLGKIDIFDANRLMANWSR